MHKKLKTGNIIEQWRCNWNQWFYFFLESNSWKIPQATENTKYLERAKPIKHKATLFSDHKFFDRSMCPTVSVFSKPEQNLIAKGYNYNIKTKIKKIKWHRWQHMVHDKIFFRNGILQ